VIDEGVRRLARMIAARMAPNGSNISRAGTGRSV
jgi:hypothetical protein